MFATAAVTLAACAHVLSGGQLPGSGILMAVLALAGLACTAATRLHLGFPAASALLGAGQVALHEAFTAFGGTVPGTPAGGAHHHGPAGLPTGVLTQLQSHEPDSPLDLLMLTGHTLATLVCALLLAKGEDALWALAAWLRPLTRLPSAVTHDAGAAPAAVCWPADSAPLPWRNLRPDSRRGPPAAVVLS
ncbi:hypothetical protein [Arthrobacter sp. NicSoilB8]|jgi:hypothetical protein|uniref:hypothetical protein n=1 Tax=Arthrobacter sp. NicSoilB8 TaxID=2830998 RepID=UPI001CC3B9EE|nr:hypothetical protein [Arthrobacter sp. NicSoilB8]BCW69601.1 hypothetical protein NicSoilB8_06450 [Arthrobacter sp. NicSoilB8]